MPTQNISPNSTVAAVCVSATISPITKRRRSRRTPKTAAPCAFSSNNPKRLRRHLYYSHFGGFVCEFEREELGDAALFHRDAEEDVTDRHGPFVVGDDEELAAPHTMLDDGDEAV